MVVKTYKVVHKATKQNTENIQHRNTYVVNNFYDKYVTRYYKKLDSIIRRLFPVIV